MEHAPHLLYVLAVGIKYALEVVQAGTVGQAPARRRCEHCVGRVCSLDPLFLKSEIGKLATIPYFGFRKWEMRFPNHLLGIGVENLQFPFPKSEIRNSGE